jgi:membrane peptidoglycan carboxypeptidase
MANAYGVFAANGIRAEPLMVRKITDRLGNVIEDNTPVLHRVDVKPETIAKMQELFQAVVMYGTAAGSGARNIPTAHGKTGTTEKHTDAWFIGYTLQPPLVTAVWAGNRNNKPMRHAFGGTISAPIWAHFMADAVKITPKTKLDTAEHLAEGDLGARQRTERDDSGEESKSKEKQRRGPNGELPSDTALALSAAQASPGDANSGSMVRVRVCEESYELATSRCPHTRLLEYVSGLQPRQFCTLHPGTRTRHRLRRSRRREPVLAHRAPADESPAPAAPSSTDSAGPTPDAAAPPPSPSTSDSQ